MRRRSIRAAIPAIMSRGGGSVKSDIIGKTKRKLKA